MRIVFASIGSLGDLHPLLAMATECRTRGHETIIAASVTYQQYLEDMGWEFRPLRPALDHDSNRRQYFSHPTRGPERLMREELFPSVRLTYDDLCEATVGADVLIVGELLYVAPLVAAKHNIPWANVILSPSSFLSACDPCVLAPAPWLHGLRHLGPSPHRLVFALGRNITSRWGEPLQDLRKELGFPPGPSPIFEGKYSPHLVLAGFPEFFAAPQADWPPAVVQTGFPFFSQQPSTRETLSDFHAADDPPVVFTLGSTAVHIAQGFYDLAAATCEELGCRGILLIGQNPPPQNPSERLLVLDYAPLDTVLPGSVAVVHHGGMGSCGETLRAGLPAVVIPFGYDQPDNAERLRGLGVARVIPRHRVDGPTLTDALRRVLSDPGMTERARELSQKIHPARELTRTAEAIEGLVGRAKVR